MASTYEPIATTTLGSAAATITFSSISSTYTDLRLVIVPKSTSTATNVRIRFNGDTATNYSWLALAGTGSSAVSGSGTTQSSINASEFANTSDTYPTLHTIDVFSYAGSTYKTALTQSSADVNGSGGVARGVGLWRSTSAINSVTAFCQTGTFAAGTTATIYGILKA